VRAVAVDKIVVKRGGRALHSENQSGRLVLICASHTRRILASGVLKSKNVTEDLPRWTPEQTVTASIVKKLEELNLDECDCVVFDLFSNDIYIGTDSKGFGILPFKDQDD
jgi:hypothetical protein